MMTHRPVQGLLSEHSHIITLCDTNKMAFYLFIFFFLRNPSQGHHRNAEMEALEEYGLDIQLRL